MVMKKDEEMATASRARKLVALPFGFFSGSTVSVL